MPKIEFIEYGMERLLKREWLLEKGHRGKNLKIKFKWGILQKI